MSAMRLSYFCIVFLFFLSFTGCRPDDIELPMINPPTIEFIEPAENFSFIQDTFPVFITSVLSDDPVKKVGFFEGGQHLYDDFNPPYQYAWEESAYKDAGQYTMEARLYDLNESVQATAERNVIIIDPRHEWIDDYDFTVFYEGWELSLGYFYDTLFYDGEIRNFEFSDLSGGGLSGYYNGDQYMTKLTVVFGDDLKMVSLVDYPSQLKTTYGDRYCHMGGFSHPDTLSFMVYVTPGQSYSRRYNVTGIRK